MPLFIVPTEGRAVDEVLKQGDHRRNSQRDLTPGMCPMRLLK